MRNRAWYSLFGPLGTGIAGSGVIAGLGAFFSSKAYDACKDKTTDLLATVVSKEGVISFPEINATVGILPLHLTNVAIQLSDEMMQTVADLPANVAQMCYDAGWIFTALLLATAASSTASNLYSAYLFNKVPTPETTRLIIESKDEDPEGLGNQSRSRTLYS